MVTLGSGARGLVMRGGIIRYIGTAAETVLTLGDGGTVRNGEKLYAGLQVVRATQSDRASEQDIGVLVRTSTPAWSTCGWFRASPTGSARSATAAASRTAPSTSAARWQRPGTPRSATTAAATSTTSATTLAALSVNGLDGIAPTGRGLLLDAQKGFAFGAVAETARPGLMACLEKLLAAQSRSQPPTERVRSG